MSQPTGTSGSSNDGRDARFRWGLFVVVIGSVLPFLITWILNVGAGRPHSLYDIFGDGDLLVTCFVIASAGIGELIGGIENRRSTRLAIFAGASSLIVILLSYTWYASINTGGHFTKATVTWYSIALFVAAVVTGYACLRATTRRGGR